MSTDRGMPPVWDPELAAVRRLTRLVREPFSAKRGRVAVAAERILGNVKIAPPRPPTLEGSRWARVLQPFGVSLEGGRPTARDSTLGLLERGPHASARARPHISHVSLEGPRAPIRAASHDRRANASLPPARGTRPALYDPYAL